MLNSKNTIQARTTKGTSQNDLVEKALHMLNSQQDSRFVLDKTEQARAVKDLLDGKDVLSPV